MLKLLERGAWTAGVVAVVVWGGLRFTGAWSAQEDIVRFTAASQALSPAAPPDTSLWSPRRILGWRSSLDRDLPPVLGVLRISKIKLEVPILEGTSDWTLNRGVGHIEGTARPGADGNAGIAGHRDGFFRGLKDVQTGDAIELDTGASKTMFRIERIWIVKPDDVSVLNPTPSPALTLVTCYPFFFVGSAPERYIVRAVPATRSSSSK
jgi:sortase A